VLDRLLHRVPTKAPVASTADRERRLAEQWLEDEALRGDLDDATWQPIQDWLLAVASRAAAATAGQDDAEAEPVLDSVRADVKALASTLTDALQAGTGATDFAPQLEALHHHLRPPVVERERLPRVHAALRDATAEVVRSRADGPTAAAQVVGALGAGIMGQAAQA
jgi:hypothetical protein